MDHLLTQLSAISPIDWFAMITGIVGVYLSIKERILAWPFFMLFGITMSLLLPRLILVVVV